MEDDIVLDPRGKGAISPPVLENGQPNIIDYSNQEPLLFGLGQNSSHDYPGKIVINNESRYVDREVKRETIPNAAATGEGAVGANVTQPTIPTGGPQLEIRDHNMGGLNFNDKIKWNEAEYENPLNHKFIAEGPDDAQECQYCGFPKKDHNLYFGEAIKLDPMAGDLKQSLPVSQAFSDTGNNPHIVPDIELDPNAEDMAPGMDYKKLGKPFNEKSDTGDDLTRTGPGGEEPSDNYNIKRYESAPGDIKLNIATPYYDGKAPHDVSGIVPELQDKNETIQLLPCELKEDIMITNVYKKEEESRDIYALLIAAGLIVMSIGEFQTAMKSGDYRQLKSLKKQAKKVTDDITKIPGITTPQKLLTPEDKPKEEPKKDDIPKVAATTIPMLKPYDFVRYQYNMQENCPICRPLDKLEFWVDDPKRPIVPSENLGRGVYNTHPNCKCSNIPFIKLLADNEAPKSVNKGKSKLTKESLAERQRITQEYLRPLNEAVNYRQKAPAEFSWIDSKTINEMQKHAESNKKGRFILAVASGESYTDHRIEGTEKHRRHWTEDEMRQNIRTAKGKRMDINHLVAKKDPYSGGIFDSNWNEQTKKGEMILFESDPEILTAIRDDIIGAVSINTGPPRTIELNCDSGECLLEPHGTHLGNHKGIALSYVVTSPKGFTYNGQWLYPLPPGMKFTKLYLVE